MRSLLFVPADSERKLARARQSGAHALILDLEDSVVPANRSAARTQARAFLAATEDAGIRRYVRIASCERTDVGSSRTIANIT